MSMDILSLYGNLFTFNGRKCNCKIETFYTPEGTEKHRLRIREISDANIRFAFMPEQGLITIDLKTGAAEKENILSELVSIKMGDIHALATFFEKYGFWLPLTDKYLESFEASDILNIHKRILYTIKILSALQQKKTDYMKLYSQICWLTLMTPTQLKSSESGDSIIYQTCVHKFIEYMNGTIPVEKPEQDSHELMYGSLYDNPDAKIMVKDSIRAPETLIYGSSLIEAMMAESDYDNPEYHIEDRPILSLANLINLFRFTENINGADRFIIEYFYHMETEIGQISGINENDDLIFFKDIKDNYKRHFDSLLKKATIKAAKLIVKEEIDYNLSEISPSYNIQTMSPSWKIPDLMTALFFSIFYMRSDLEVYRKCENQNCTKYFLVSTTNSRKKYCSPGCANAMAQRMHRKRKKVPIQIDTSLKADHT